MKKISFLSIFFAFVAAVAFAEVKYDKITVETKDGSTEVEIPSDFADFVRGTLPTINERLKDTVSKAEVEKAVEEARKIYDGFAGKGMVSNPVTTTMDGLNDFTEDLAAAVLNTQLIQNVWPEAWIGKFFPTGLHFGGGINAGVSQMNVTSLKSVGDALKIDMGGLPDKLVFPTLTVDFRVGGIILPFDVGFNVMKLDTSTLGLKSALDPVTFDFFTIGFDGRWAFLKGEGALPKVSVGAGFAFTSGNVEMENDDAKAGLDFTAKQFYLSGQISKKLAFFVPYAGLKLGFAWSNVDWSAVAKWENIFSGDKSQLENLQKWGILPTHFSGELDDFAFYPRLDFGFGLDFAILNMNFAFGYDPTEQLLSGALSIRLAW